MKIELLDIYRYKSNSPTEHTQAFFDRLHGDAGNARVFVQYGYSNKSKKVSGKIQYFKRFFQKEFPYDYETNRKDVFCSVNLFKFFGTGKNEMRTDNICNYNLIAIRLVLKQDNPDSTNIESELMDHYFEFCGHDTYCVPNAFSYEGDGNVILYYSLIPCIKGIERGLTALKYEMAKNINVFLGAYAAKTGILYEIDTRTFDCSAKVRLPGTINTKTGLMCEFYETNFPKYPFELLLSYQKVNFDDWDRLNREPSKTTNRTTLKNIAKKAKLGIIPKSDKCGKKIRNLMKLRIYGIFEWFDNKSYISNNEQAINICFMLRQFCKALNMETKDELEIAEEFCRMYTFIEKNDMISLTSNKKPYIYSNQKIAELLGTTVDDPEFIRIFHVCVSKPKKYGMKGNRAKRAQNYIKVAKIMAFDSRISNRELCDRTELSIDQVKKIAAQFRKNPSDAEIWAGYDLSADKNEIMTYLDTHGYDKASAAVKYKSKKNSKEANNIVKTKAIPEKEAPVTAEDLLIFLKKESVSIKSRNPRNNEYHSFLKKCKKLVILYTGFSREEKVTGSSSPLFEKDNKAQAGKDAALSNIYHILIDELSIPEYTAKKLVYGYRQYSTEELELINCALFRWGYPVCPKPCTKPMYDIIIPITEYENKVFKYDPWTLSFKVYNATINMLKVPELYKEWYYLFRSHYLSYLSLKKSYKKYAIKHNDRVANNLAVKIDHVISTLKTIESTYLTKELDLKVTEPEYKDFNAVFCNEAALKIIIKESTKTKTFKIKPSKIAKILASVL